MFCGMSFCLPLAFMLERKQRRAAKAAAAASDAAEPLLPAAVSSRGCVQEGGGTWMDARQPQLQGQLSPTVCQTSAICALC